MPNIEEYLSYDYAQEYLKGKRTELLRENCVEVCDPDVKIPVLRYKLHPLTDKWGFWDLGTELHYGNVALCRRFRLFSDSKNRFALNIRWMIQELKEIHETFN